jgi:predicted short-subunit dehydrogenase-like oxidoreductase (DUF2520 family)
MSGFGESISAPNGFGLLAPSGYTCIARYPLRNWSSVTFKSACVVGAGRVGKALAARLGERIPARTTGREVEVGDAELVVICVPDRVIPEVAQAIKPGPWVTHTSGACRLDALEPHQRRFSFHPLQTFVLDLGPEQLDGSCAAVSGEDEEALAAAHELATLLRVKPFELDDDERPLYHAAAHFASAFLVTLRDVAADLMEAAGAPPEALEPLMRRTMENGFNHTGPLVRGDWTTIERHLDAIGARRPELLPLYRALADTETALLRMHSR